ncbi:hypothetical protein C8R44DRAFT_811288 [Mycena epipterygia]|nr:hypothetical protein C8R44DRAFT_811288 [Mycena epipterygia]
MNMKLFLLVAAMNLLAASAMPIPPTRIISPYVTQFTQRTAPHPVRSHVTGLVSRIPEVLEVRKPESDDIFLARALEDTVFASAQDIVRQRSYMEIPRTENAVNSDN